MNQPPVDMGSSIREIFKMRHALSAALLMAFVCAPPLGYAGKTEKTTDRASACDQVEALMAHDHETWSSLGKRSEKEKRIAKQERKRVKDEATKKILECETASEAWKQEQWALKPSQNRRFPELPKNVDGSPSFPAPGEASKAPGPSKKRGTLLGRGKRI